MKSSQEFEQPILTREETLKKEMQSKFGEVLGGSYADFLSTEEGTPEKDVKAEVLQTELTRALINRDSGFVFDATGVIIDLGRTALNAARMPRREPRY